MLSWARQNRRHWTMRENTCIMKGWKNLLLTVLSILNCSRKSTNRDTAKHSKSSHISPWQTTLYRALQKRTRSYNITWVTTSHLLLLLLTYYICNEANTSKIRGWENIFVYTYTRTSYFNIIQHGPSYIYTYI